MQKDRKKSMKEYKAVKYSPKKIKRVMWLLYQTNEFKTKKHY